jgi:hypothetical protein
MSTDDLIWFSAGAMTGTTLALVAFAFSVGALIWC